MLAAIRHLGENPSIPSLQELTSNWKDGRVKLFLIWKALNFRRDHGELFSEGDLTTLRVIGRRRGNIAAFERRNQRESILAIVPRWLARPNGRAASTSDASFWANTQVVVPFRKVPAWRNILTGEDLTPTHGKDRRSIAVAQLLRHFPVALLFGREAETPSRKKRKKRRAGKS
jgi:(1->4)-alpha-D-glucan 1-alpha-D-glucosylmutase